MTLRRTSLRAIFCRWHHWCTPRVPISARVGGGGLVNDSLNILHRLTFARGSEALDFVRTLRELTERQLSGDADGLGPVLVYGARIVAPDSPSELYVSMGALTLTHVLGMGTMTWGPARGAAAELPADMALLFANRDLPDENALR